MLLNVGFDLLLGLVPFAGDVADVFWQSNTRNLALLERYMPVGGRVPPATRRDWAFVAGVLGALAFMAAVPFILFGWLLSEVGRGLF
jgi:hypothetical protein